MKTVLWAGTMANGFYPVNPTTFVTPDDVWTAFFADVAAAGNVILGRRTVEESVAVGYDLGVPLVIAVSSQATDFPGVVHAPSPRAALDHVAAAGHATALVGGGAALLNAFLAANLADELILVISPAIGGRDPMLALDGGAHRSMRLLSCREFGSGVIRLHYAIERAGGAPHP